MRLGIVTALPGELECFGASAKGEEAVELAPGVCARLSGIGPARAERAARDLIERGARALASFGVAGGLDPRLSPGDVVLASEVVDLHGARHVADPAWRGRLLALRPGLVEGAIAESEVVLASKDAKSERARATGAAAVDMESGAVARAALAAGVPFVALRAICDPAWTTVPRASLLAVDGAGKLRLGALAGALLRRPSDLAGLFAMHTGWRRALRALSELAAQLGAELAAGPEHGEEAHA